MSLDSLRDAVSREKKSEIAKCANLRKRKLRELYAYTALLNGALAPDRKAQDFSTLNLDVDPDPPEQRFLDENDIFKGRSFQDSTLPSPFPPQPKAPASLNTLSLDDSKSISSKTIQTDAPRDTDANETGLRASPTAIANAVNVRAPKLAVDVVKEESKLPEHLTGRARSPSPAADDQSLEKVSLISDFQQKAQSRSNVPDPTTGSFKDAIKTDPQIKPDVESLSTRISDQLGRRQPVPKEAFLNASDKQEVSSMGTKPGEDPSVEKDKKEDEKLNLPAANHAGEPASSPSSTVGPYSTTTPHPNIHSPDTSPDEESFGSDTTLMRSTNPTRVPGEAIREGRDSSQWTGKAARAVPREATPETPDAQLRMEDEQALRSAQNAHLAARDSSKGDRAPRVSIAMNDAPSKQDTQGPINGSHVSPNNKASSRTGKQVNGEPSVAVKIQESPIAQKRAPVPSDRQPTPPPEVDMEDAPELSPNRNEAPVTLAPAERTVAAPATPRQPIHKTREGTPILHRITSNLPKSSDHTTLNDSTAPVGALTPVSGALLAPELSQRKSPRKDKGKRRLSKVIFDGRSPGSSSNALQLYSEDYASLKGASTDEKKDYLLSLFTHQAYQPPRSVPLQELLHSANKTLSTTNYTSFYREHQDNSILKRIYNLQNANRWPLRQLQKAPEPPRPETFLDHFLASVKWMSTDFREERKWKMAAAKMMAEWCAEWVSANSDRRQVLRIKSLRAARRPNGSGDRDEMMDAPTPELVHSQSNETESDILDDDDPCDEQLVTPAELFTYGYDNVVIQLDHTPATEGLLLELPVYDPSEKRLARPSSAPSPEPPADPYIVETSIFVKGKLRATSAGPPRKRSRYEYEQEEEGPGSPSKRHSPERSIPSTPGGRRLHRNDLPPEQTDCALFKPENKHVRDRLHAGHAFRPPSEFPMPATTFFESRSSSQWLWEEDQKLRTLVKEYAFNWSLVSDQLSFPSMYTSGAERRTPWECFERWVQLEGLPADMSKTQYFRTYQSRLEAAQRTVSAQHQAAQQQLAQQGQATPQALNTPLRRRTAQPFRVERRRGNRHLALIDAMRKLARKRESAAHKQQEAAKAAALRKAHEAPTANKAVRTPAEYSKLRHEHDLKYGVENDLYRRQMLARQQAMARAQAQGIPAPVATPRSAGPTQNPNPQTNGVSSPHAQTSNAASSVPVPTRPHLGQPAMQATMPNGNIPALPIGLQGMPRAQIPMNMVNQQLNPQQARILQQQALINRQHYLQQQQAQAQQAQQQQLSQPGNLAAAHLAGTNLAMQNPHLMAQMNAPKLNGAPNTAINGMTGSSSSPPMAQVAAAHGAQGRPLSSGQIPLINQLQARIQSQHPEWAPEQVNEVAKRELQRIAQQQHQRQNALNAAAGNLYQQNGSMIASPNTANQALYPPQFRPGMMQRAPQQAGSPNMASARPPSRSATPQNPQQQQQQQQQQQHSQSPGMGQAQVARS